MKIRVISSTSLNCERIIKRKKKWIKRNRHTFKFTRGREVWGGGGVLWGRTMFSAQPLFISNQQFSTNIFISLQGMKIITLLCCVRYLFSFCKSWCSIRVFTVCPAPLSGGLHHDNLNIQTLPILIDSSFRYLSSMFISDYSHSNNLPDNSFCSHRLPCFITIYLGRDL